MVKISGKKKVFIDKMIFFINVINLRFENLESLLIRKF